MSGDPSNRMCKRCSADAFGLHSSARCVCGPSVPCEHCGQGMRREGGDREAIHHARAQSHLIQWALIKSRARRLLLMERRKWKP